MGRHDPRVDAYITQAAPFARPLLHWLRAQVHAGCPDAEESIRWRMPAFLYQGRLLATMAAFSTHAAFGFRRREAIGDAGRAGALGQFGRLRAPADLPTEAQMRHWVLRAVELEATAPPRTRQPREAIAPPPAWQAALDAHPAARGRFDALTPGQRRDYVEWIAQARREDTRMRRTAQALAWLVEGKPLDWKYRRQ